MVSCALATGFTVVRGEAKEPRSSSLDIARAGEPVESYFANNGCERFT